MTDTVSIPTKDIYFAAALLAMGAELDNVDRSDPQHVRFKFIRGVELKELESEWNNGKLFPGYAEAIRRVKSMVHARE